MSVQEFAQELEVTSQALRDVENGEPGPTSMHCAKHLLDSSR